ncbi:penicillin-binding protein [Streptomyces chrestomyceticus JCM 4735]|uniref:Penicillin-binding protein n=1 Tax=Streptomyces chrestomyceticus JCM 4735 TaxID=1306181 RepID=A0A7U9KZB4_9ACTN|nr:penicillin-binding transpeptidase domain-containing protein [Streptomyces chrestomyceticus]GCD37513.1 penicillin-binding protein [Streptomyces chrestomyceticus JCM 4735]
MRTGVKYVVGGVFAAVVGVVGVGAYNVYEAFAGGDSGTSGTTAGTTASRPTGPPSEEEVRNTARDFLAAWSKGDTETAALLTDNAEGARRALTGFHDDGLVSKVSFEAGQSDGAKVPFHVTAELSVGKGDGKAKGTDEGKDAGEGKGGSEHSTWSYDSALRVVRGKTTGKALVDWQPTVVHPALHRGESLQTGSDGAPPVKAVDRNGAELDAEALPSLGAILPALRESYGEKAGGVQGIEVRVVGESGEPGRTLHTVVKGREGTLRTTLDANVQRAAEAAVKDYRQASVVVVKPGSGDILAVANHRTDQFNAAFQGRLAPGSTMKVVTAAMLMEKGLVSAGKSVECPKYASAGGRSFHNQGMFAISGGTFADSFARSCNTAFISLADRLSGTDLSDEAQEVFGLGKDWKAGIPTFDGSVPQSDGAETPAALIGQGRVQANPLNMASVAATAKAGYFSQPVLVSPELDGRRVAHASRALPPSVAAQLRAMMRRTAVSGTGARAMAGLSGDIGAKTGSAEADGQGDANSWFLGYRNDAAAAAVVQQGGHGGDAAGPIVRRVLAARR